MSIIALVCVVCAGLALGILTAYGICNAMFAAFRMHTQRLAPAAAPSAKSVPALTAAAPAIGS